MIDQANVGAVTRTLTIIGWLNQYFDRTDLKGAEIGVFIGYVTKNLLWLQPRLHLLMVDQWAPIDPNCTNATSGDDLAVLPVNNWTWVYAYAITNTELYADRRTILRGDSVAMADKVEDESLDFVFIDADHTYEGCLRDLKAWIPKVKPDGLIIGHDIDSPNYPKWGVRRAVAKIGIETPILGGDHTWCFQMKSL